MNPPVKYAFIDPEGTIHRGENVRRFAAKHGLDAGGMHKVHMGDKTSYKGWVADEEWYLSGDSSQ
jgi:hypothetical protein